MLLYETLSADSYLEYAFLRWILTPSVNSNIFSHVSPQYPVNVEDHTYKIDYAFIGLDCNIAVELDGFEYHGNRYAFSYDRMRQNDLQSVGWHIIRFSYDSIRSDTARCIAQLQSLLTRDAQLRGFLIPDPAIEIPNMEHGALHGLAPSPTHLFATQSSYFDKIRDRLNLLTLRDCQLQGFSALANYFHTGGLRAACIMSVGAGKTGLGVVTCLGLAKKRALIVSPGSVIRGTFDRAFDAQAVGNVLTGLPGGPLIPGCKPPRVLTLDRDDGPIRNVSRRDLLQADVIITNFHSIGTSTDPDGVLSKMDSTDVDLIVVDEAHIAAAASYQHLFRHFQHARVLLMSACFQRLDGKPIDADVVYRYRLIDAIADGHARNLRLHRFAPDVAQTTYEIIWPNGHIQEIVGRDALLAVIQDERKIGQITAKSEISISQVMHAVRQVLDNQTKILYPIKPRVLFSALGEKHAAQLARIANEHGIPCSYVHYSMPPARIKSLRERFEHESGDLQGLVHINMLGQGYDFPPITVVVPMRPYGSFGEFYQFIGRGIRVLQPVNASNSTATQQFVDIVFHAEMGLDEHIETILRENDMGPQISNINDGDSSLEALRNSGDATVVQVPETYVLFEAGQIEQRIIHDEDRVEQSRQEREKMALAQRYATYVQASSNPVPFNQFVLIMRQLHEA